MKLETFFEKFELFAETPGAVAKMRELVLELAVQGKLTQQLASDDSVEKLLQEIHAEKVSLSKDGLIKKADRIEAFSGNLQLPSQWKVAPLAALCVSVTDGDHLPPPKSETGVPFLVIGDVRWGSIDFADCRHVSEEYFSKLDWIRKPKQNDILYTLVGSFGIPVIVRESRPFCVQRHLGILRPSKHIELQYLAYALASKHVFRQAALVATGIAQKTVPLAGLRKIAIPLPPLSEQRRIVAKVSELMALVDQLEKQQQEREAQRAKLASASLARFSEAPTQTNLSSLFHTSYSTKPADLYKSILALALRGKLVAQDPNDEPGKEFLQKISTEQEKLIKARQIRRIETAPMAQNDQPFAVPSTWVWTRLSQIGDWGSGSTPPRGNHEFYGGNVPWLKSGELNDNRALAFSEESVTELALKSCSFRLNKPGDVLLAMYGATIGKAAILTKSAVTNQAVCGCTPFAGILNTYLFIYLISQRDAFHAASEGGAQPNISKTKIVGYPFPLPPLDEQRRILVRLDELMALVDQLEAQLANAKSASTALLDAAIHELLNPSADAVAFPAAQTTATDRAGIGCYVVQKLAGHKTFGRVALMKHEYLAEAHVGATLDGQYQRQAAGPLDSWVYRFEEDAAREGWFTVEETKTRDGHKKIVYRKGAGLDAKASVALAALPQAQRDELDRVLALLGGKPTEEVEIIATLFAVWNDFLIDGHSPSDEDIVTGFREHWHKNKQKFTAKSLHAWLDWMRRNGLVPTGRGPRTQQHSKLDLH